jgi:small subunit ribosomal protein S3
MVAEGLEKRLPFRRVLKQTIEKVMANRDVKGCPHRLGGMLGGGSMSRREELKKGRVPLQTFRSDIDYAKERANLPLGVSASRSGSTAARSLLTKPRIKNK